MKDQFQATEELKVRFPPFINKNTGAEILGTDTCTVTYRKPPALTGVTGSASASWDATIQMWVLDIVVLGNYLQGEWSFKAVSSDVDARTQRKVLQWGDYVGNIDALVSSRATQADILSDSTPFAGADIGDIMERTDNLPDDPATETTAQAAADAADDAKSAAEGVASDATITRKMAANGWKVQGTQLIIYDDDGIAIYKVFDLKDESGNPSGTRVFQRVPA
jgi:hypothetical protein